MSATKTEVAAAPAWNHTRQCQAGGANSQEPVLPIASVLYKRRNAAFMSFMWHKKRTPCYQLIKTSISQMREDMTEIEGQNMDLNRFICSRQKLSYLPDLR